MSSEAAEVDGSPSIAVLRGSECQQLGSVSLVAEGNAAIALSQGGARKRYAHTDPNEDAAAFALGTRDVLLAVADGHNGCAAAELAIEELVQRAGAQLSRGPGSSAADWKALALEILSAIQTALHARVEQGVRGHSRTTLAFAHLSPDRDRLAYALVGDSHVFRVEPGEVVDLGDREGGRRGFLGNPADDLEAIAANGVFGVEAIANTRAVVLATDGISESGIGVEVPEFAVAECARDAERFSPELRALELARSVAEAALAAHRRHRSGDNIAAAVALLPQR